MIKTAVHFPSAGKPLPKDWLAELPYSPNNYISVWEHEGGFRVLVSPDIDCEDLYAYMWKEDAIPHHEGVLMGYNYEVQLV